MVSVLGQCFQPMQAMTCQVRMREMNESERLKKHRKTHKCRQNQRVTCFAGISLGETCQLPRRRPVYRQHESHSGLCMEHGNLMSRCQGRTPSGGPTRCRVPKRDTGADQLVVVKKSGNADGAKGLNRPVEIRSQPEMGGAEDGNKVV